MLHLHVRFGVHAPRQCPGAKLFCELLDVDVRSLVAHEGGTSCNGSDQGSDSNTVGGLCCNCENRRTCTIRIPEGDVWHCEEYC